MPASTPVPTIRCSPCCARRVRAASSPCVSPGIRTVKATSRLGLLPPPCSRLRACASRVQAFAGMALANKPQKWDPADRPHVGSHPLASPRCQADIPGGLQGPLALGPAPALAPSELPRDGRCRQENGLLSPSRGPRGGTHTGGPGAAGDGPRLCKLIARRAGCWRERPTRQKTGSLCLHLVSPRLLLQRGGVLCHGGEALGEGPGDLAVARRLRTPSSQAAWL